MRRHRKFLLAAGSMLGAFLFLEGMLRLWLTFAPTPARSAYVPDPDCGYRLRPSSAERLRTDPDNYINAFGFRDREHSLRKPPNTWRVVGIGDSFVYGAVRPDDNFLRVAERRLNSTASGTQRNEVLMMGLGGYSPENALGVLRSVGLQVKPDVVVLCFFVGNDVTGIPLRGRVWRGELYFTGALWRWHDALRHSCAYIVAERAAIMHLKWPLLRAMGRRNQEMATATEAPTDAALAGPMPPLTPVYLDFQPRRLPVYRREPGSRMRGLWRETEQALDAFDRTCKAAEVPWLLLLIPDELQVDAEVRQAVLAALKEPTARYDFAAPQRRLQQFAAAHQVQLLDVLPAFQQAHRPEARLYVPNDSHWNERGNQIAGELLGDFLAALRDSVSR